MSIEQKVKLVEALFSQLDLEISQFQNHSKLQCLTGCGNCCTNATIEASPLEFLPWAFHMYLIGKAEDALKTLKPKTKHSVCHLYSPLNLTDTLLGSCENYRYRGLICRLFGYAASRDKYGKKRLITCKIIKENQQNFYNETMEAINAGLYIPMFTDYYMQLAQIDFKLGHTIVPINKALKLALEDVLQYYAYRPFPGGLEQIA
ncbi:YkgJ family cysteine cluster protein [Aestuariibaculum suncheonense]|uniref:YkgJ family cysteine cluster protein n=1 Tax=Aestuariibaculum suncheonense TaxID=1028745 RepID=A0A8J6QF58_9FLAO|nr:YkgJ family cysteine cluster protein [Aestuariibaculum suncheonense]MBD0834561.1 YkgJ family cysteine cluster protein [Aestuariibaculum suncheonense]